MKKVTRIDNTGLFIEDIMIEIGEPIPKDCIETPCQDGFYRPRWNGNSWIEGLTPQEIEALINGQPDYVVIPDGLRDVIAQMNQTNSELMDLLFANISELQNL